MASDTIGSGISRVPRSSYDEVGKGQIVVTPEMIVAGLEEFREHHYDIDTAYMLEAVFRVMSYASLERKK